ncbi:TPA: NYN domain-containing protein, partial [Klebsiella pneumoniae]|nr:NYN domain-containing protein [Klebsiella pneumoniae]HCQ7289082.1 NYN domain-containing protein [Klebsiella pneumoniae]
DDHKKIAVLIDADNAQYSKVKAILNEISAHGHIVIKRAYGDWSSEYLKNWKGFLNELAIQPIQQFAYTTGKNSTDASMIIDAMDLLYSNKFDAFALVSSDSDFTKLASRLRESEIFVFGVGENKTPISFRNACDDFIFTENLNLEAIAESSGMPKETSLIGQQNAVELIPILRKAWEQYQDDDGWANVSSTGSFVKRSKPDFDPRSYGATKLPEIIQNLSSDFEMKKYKGKGTVNIIAYRPVTI